MVAGGAVHDGVCAAGVVADHAADHRTVGGGCFRGEPQPVRLQCQVELVADDARLHAHSALLRINRKDPVEVTAEVYNQAGTDHLSGEGRACGARNQSDPMGVGKAHQHVHIKFMVREGDPERALLILGGVRRVDGAQCIVYVEFALELRRE